MTRSEIDTLENASRAAMAPDTAYEADAPGIGMAAALNWTIGLVVIAALLLFAFS